ncbi:MAG: hypothetical protein ACI389_04705 [Methanobrevibacter sp.]|uniref:hypothetical protein n=1 Tax=Methanobrevibacter sp. TaxID=66852 RepID=UPI003F105CD6
MKLKCILLVIILFVLIPHISAEDTNNWKNVTVNKVTFKIPEKFSNGTLNKDNTGYTHGEPFDFIIFSLVKNDNLKRMYGYSYNSRYLNDSEETEIAGHHAVVLYQYNDYYNHDFLEVFFATGKKIFRIQYNSDHVTNELKEIIKSTPKSKISKETFLNKLDTAQRDYCQENYMKNLEVDLEYNYHTQDNHHKPKYFYYLGSHGRGVGMSYSW